MATVKEKWGHQRAKHQHRQPTDRRSVPGRVNPPGSQNYGQAPHVMLYVRAISEAHVAEPGLAVVEVAAALAGRWATAVTDQTYQEPGEPGVRLTCYLDVRQELGT